MKKILLITGVALSMIACGDDKKDGDKEEGGSESTLSGGAMETAKNTCYTEFMKSLKAGGGQSVIDMVGEEKLESIGKEYCACAVEKVSESGMDINEMAGIDESKLQEVAGECLEDLQSSIMSSMSSGM